MSNSQQKFSGTEDDHKSALKVAKEVLYESKTTRELERERLENALKKYKERSEHGPSRHF